MPSPSIRSGTVTNITTAGTPSVLNLPATVSAGDVLLVLVRFPVGQSGATTWPAGWTTLKEESPDSDDDTTVIKWKKADGTEGGTTISVTNPTSSKAAACAWAVQDAADPTILPPQIATAATGSASSPDPPSLTPGDGPLYMFGGLVSLGGEPTFSSNPLNMPVGGQNANTGTAGATTTNGHTAGSFNITMSTSGDPGIYTYTGTVAGWTGYTIAFRGDPKNTRPAPLGTEIGMNWRGGV